MTDSPVSPTAFMYDRALIYSDQRNPVCVEKWPECEDGAYNPACCRFPKSCSCGMAPPVPVEVGREELAEVLYLSCHPEYDRRDWLTVVERTPGVYRSFLEQADAILARYTVTISEGAP